MSNITSLVPVIQTTITTTFSSRIVAHALLAIERVSGGGNLQCQLEIAPSGSSTFTNISQVATSFFTSTIGLYETVIPHTGAAVEAAGTYVIRGECQSSSVGDFIGGDLTAVAAAQ